MGPSGSGKTVVLNEMEDMARAAGWVVLSLDAATPGILDRVMASVAGAHATHEALGPHEDAARAKSLEKRFGLSLGPLTGLVSWTALHDRRMHMGLREHLAFLAQAAADHETSVLLTIDELQAADRAEGRRLSNDLQHITKRAGSPLAFIGAGLPEMRLTLMQDPKMTFFHRCEHIDLPPLSPAEAAQGLFRTIADSGGTITPEALRLAADAVDGSPYKMQVIGDQAWRSSGAPDNEIGVAHAEAACVAADAVMDQRIGLPAWHDLSDEHQDMLGILASADSPLPSHEVASRLGAGARPTNKALRRLHAMGYAEQPRRGFYTPTSLISARVIADEWGSAPPSSVPSAAGASRCRRWMPRSRAYCVLASGHAGGCRSR